MMAAVVEAQRRKPYPTGPTGDGVASDLSLLVLAVAVDQEMLHLDQVVEVVQVLS